MNNETDYVVVDNGKGVYICFDRYNNDDLQVTKQYAVFLREQGFVHFRKFKDFAGSYAFVRKLQDK